MLTREHAGVADERVGLEGECLLLIQKKRFNGSDFVRFVSAMSRLSEISSPEQDDQYLIDNSRKVIIRFKVEGYVAEIVVEPMFFLLLEDVRSIVLDGLKEPVVVEKVRWSGNDPNFVPEVTRQLVFPKSYVQSAEFSSYVSHRTLTRTVKYEPHFEREISTADNVQALCAEVYQIRILSTI